MIIYVTQIILIFGLVSQAEQQRQKQYNSIVKVYNTSNKYTIFFAALLFLFVFAFRYRTGTDTYGYNSVYMEASGKELSDIIKENRDWLFYTIVYINSKIFGSSELGLVFNNIVIGIICYLPILMLYMNHTDKYYMSVFMYLLTAAYYFAYNGQRQGAAIGLICLGFPLLIKRKWISYMILAVIASWMHTTALIMIPIGFLVVQETGGKKFIIPTIVFFLSALAIRDLWTRLFEFLGMIGQEKIVHDYAKVSNDGSTGVNILRVAVNIAPTIMGCIFYKKLRMQNRNFCIVLNSSIIGSIFMLAAFSNWVFARFTNYFEPMKAILIVELSMLFNEKERKIFWVIVVLLYSFYWWTYLHMDSDLLPYYFFNGNYKFY